MISDCWERLGGPVRDQLAGILVEQLNGTDAFLPHSRRYGTTCPLVPALKSQLALPQTSTVGLSLVRCVLIHARVASAASPNSMANFTGSVSEFLEDVFEHQEEFR